MCTDIHPGTDFLTNYKRIKTLLSKGFSIEPYPYQMQTCHMYMDIKAHDKDFDSPGR